MAELAAGGSTRRALAQLAPAITGSPVGRSLARGLLWAFAPALVGPGWDPSDMVATIRAEYAFDVGDELGGISAPTLVVGGDRDPVYPPEMFAETARRVPNARLVLYEGRGHAGALYDRRYAGDVAPFLGLEASPP